MTPRAPIAIIAVTVAAALAADLTAAATCNPTLQNTDFYGGDIVNKHGQVEDCCNLCIDQSGCAAWTWSDYNGGTCWLKSSTATVTPSNGKTSGTIATADTVCSLLMQNTDYYGDDLSSVANAEPNCCEQCQKVAGCKAWTWSNYQGGTCWLKRGTGTQTTADGKVSGSLLPSTPTSASPGGQCGLIQQNTDFYGGDVANVPGKSPNDCCKPCQERSDCNAWTWSDYNGGTCWLKSGQGEKRTTPGLVSGTVVTPVHPTSTAPTTAAPPSGVCSGSCLIANYQPYGWATAPHAPPCWIKQGDYYSCFAYGSDGKCPWSNEVDCGFKGFTMPKRALRL